LHSEQIKNHSIKNLLILPKSEVRTDIDYLSVQTIYPLMNIRQYQDMFETTIA